MTRKQLPFFIGLFVLMFGAMACACLGSGVGVGGFQATANAALTQAASCAATADPVGWPAGGPSDIPMVQGVNTDVHVASADASYVTTVDFACIVKFYKDAMPKNGWTEDTTVAKETADSADLLFDKDTGKAVLSIGPWPEGGTLVSFLIVRY
jgi:hypothetical protein